MKTRILASVSVLLLCLTIVPPRIADTATYIAYISDSTSSSVIYWLAKDMGVVTEGEKIQAEKAGVRTIIDMDMLKVPFQFNYTVTTRKRIRENPDEARRVVLAMTESTHFFKRHKEESIKVMQKYTRGLGRDVLDGAYTANAVIINPPIKPNGATSAAAADKIKLYASGAKMMAQFAANSSTDRRSATR